MRADIILVIIVVISTRVLLNVAGKECEMYDSNGICLPPCPKGTNRYLPSCEDVAFSQRTCRQPVSRSLGVLCDYSSCECPDTQVWDEAAKKCVKVEYCSDQSKIKY
ncbi:hypothetical protein K1T71_005573 [Dendrolimus kikuchii]|uniref:Uncharacterized protein n=1 Tax=Dendrolimus kikuchii TaxID=765133 RepID=A0ACC1D5C8_9NEOP|nr:hypothetical protein K1T71_005573 [Dendrolimus kikuchii]